MKCGELKLDSENVVTLEGLWDETGENYVNGATVTLTLVDLVGNELIGESWPKTLTYVTGSNGDYSGTLSDAIVATEGQEVVGQVSVTSGSVDLALEVPFVFVVADQGMFLWTSRTDLDRMFGETNIDKWADLENEQDPDAIATRVRWAMEEATADARERLLGSPVDLDELFCAPRTLRIATTRLAGVLLYESRGVKDTGDEKGSHRLGAHLRKADEWFRKVQSGQLRIDPRSERTSTPKVRLESSEEESIFETDPIVGV